MTMTNLSQLPVGFVANLFGHRKTAQVGMVSWIILRSLTAMFPEAGTFYLVASIGSAMCGLTILFAVLHHTDGMALCGSTRTVGSMVVVAWDLGALAFLAVNTLYFSSLAPPLWVLFVVYAFLVGGVSLLIVRILYQQPSYEVQQRLGERFSGLCDALRTALCMPELYAYLLLMAYSVGYGDFFVAHVTSQLVFIGTHSTDINAYAKLFAWIVPFGGFIATYPGLCMRFGAVRRGMLVVMCVQSFLAVGLATCAHLGPAVHASMHVQCVAFVLFVAVRLSNFAYVFSTAGLVFPATIVSTTIGFLSTSGGVISLIFQFIIADIVENNPRIMSAIHIGFGILEVVACLAIAYLLKRLDPITGMARARELSVELIA